MGQFGAQRDKIRAQMANLEFKWAILGSKGANSVLLMGQLEAQMGQLGTQMGQHGAQLG